LFSLTRAETSNLRVYRVGERRTGVANDASRSAVDEDWEVEVTTANPTGTDTLD
jgi:hypothetical protein